MATLKEDSSAWKCTSIISRDHRHDKGDGYEDTPHKSKHGKKTRPRKKAGCPGNEGNAHIYVWIGARYVPNEAGVYIDQVGERWEYRRIEGYPYNWKPWKSREEHIEWIEQFEIQVCAGCYKKSGKKRKLSGEPVTSWWFSY